MALLQKIFGNYSLKEVKRIHPLRDRVLKLEDIYAKLSDDELKAMTEELKERLQMGQTLDDILPEAFAVCREAAWRVLGMKHFPVQIIGGIVLHQGRISEMRTGEGKTLVATLPAYLNALSGKGVHIVTVNDYLARRDSEWMGKIYRFLGLSVGLIVHGIDNDERRAAYASDITYGTNNEFGFDYLRDNMVIYKENRVQRGYNFAIVDEVDSILIDEARTPLIISGQGEKSTDLYERADKFASTLKSVTVVEINDKEEDVNEKHGDYIIDEKAKTASLTKSGVEKAEQFFSLENLNDPDNITIAHHINQAIKAHGIMHLDQDYVIKDGEIIIVDEFTGRMMFGRRYNEGLHQAIEAKEHVKVAHESQTLATITFQNFFRLYKKLSGMTGTAMTEEQEFKEIYKLDVIEIPTNKPMVRKDLPDAIYKTEEGKFRAVIEQIIECNEKGQPVLVGTITIENSEKLSNMLKKRGIKHEVLNAKFHEKEAEIVAQAGKQGSVTIATNMAGRGTDIMLGGNAEYLAKSEMRRQDYDEELIAESTGYGDTSDESLIEARKKYSELSTKFKKEILPETEAVCEAGGLFIIGTERHESRRIDNQLRGRAGRQGDAGCSKFFISLDDDLMRIFNAERITRIMETLKVDEDSPLEAGILSKSIENAQKQVESRNFSSRKHVLEYDDVMNKQRELIYQQRGKVLDGDNVKDSILSMIRETIEDNINLHCVNEEVHDDWDLDAVRAFFLNWLCEEDDFKYDVEKLGNISKKELIDKLYSKAEEIYAKKEEEFGEELMREVERVVLLRTVDSHWIEHIDAMEELKKGIGLRAYGQHDPKVEYRNEGYDMFVEMRQSIREETTRMMLTVKVRNENEVKREQVAKVTSESGPSEDGINTPIKRGKKVGRNDMCPCGSGKKYKKCHGAESAE